MASYILNESIDVHSNHVRWILLVQVREHLVDRYIIFQKAFNPKATFIMRQRVRDVSIMDKRFSYDGKYMIKTLEMGLCDLVKERPLTLKFDGEFLRGTVVLPRDYKIHRLGASK